MKIRWNGMEIECTPDEFEELYARGILTNKDTAEESLRKEYGLNEPQGNKIPKPTVAPESSRDQFPRDPFPTVAVYGCYMPNTGIPGPRSGDTSPDSGIARKE